MDFTVEGKDFRAVGVGAVVLGTAPAAAAEVALVVSLEDAAGTALRLPVGGKGWQAVALRLEHGTEVELPLPQDFQVNPGDALVLGCLGPIVMRRAARWATMPPLRSMPCAVLGVFRNCCADLRICRRRHSNEALRPCPCHPV